MSVIMPQAGKNKGNKNATLKPGELGRIQWTQTLSGEQLLKFVQYYGIDPQLEEKELRQQVSDKGRTLFDRLLLPETENSMLTGKYYVYILIQPDGTVFYVGKGQGNRIHQHEIEARKNVQSHKCNTIRKIWEDGGEIIKQKVAFFDDEDAAYQLEILLIDFFGQENITNCTAGGEGVSYGPNHKKRIPVVLSISDDKGYNRLSWVIEQLRAQGITDPTDQEVSRYVKDFCYEQIDKAMQE